MELIQTILSFIVALGVLVTIHEYGHFWVARRCGVKVLVFSVGFGKPLYRWTDKYGTEFRIASIPLGGFVEMLDARVKEVPPELMHQEFNGKPVWQRMAVFAAGPLVNLIFAVLLFWFMYLNGITTVVPVVGEVEPGSIAAEAGLRSGHELVAVDDNPVNSWQSVNLALIERIGEAGVITIKVRNSDALNSIAVNDAMLASDTSTKSLSIPISNWMDGGAEESPFELLGFKPYRPFLSATIAKLKDGSPAELGGMKAGDTVTAVNGEAVSSWYDWVDVVKANPAKPLAVDVQRDGQLLSLSLTPDAVKNKQGEWVGLIGAYSTPADWPESMIRRVDFSLAGALVAGYDKTVDLVGLIFLTIGKMIVGEMSLKNISGPITIAQVAGDTARDGVNSFLHFLAYLSISLGVFNLLPIPVLDGGHLLYGLIEAVRGKPLSERIQQIGLSLGMSILAAFMILAVYNDIIRVSQ